MNERDEPRTPLAELHTQPDRYADSGDWQSLLHRLQAENLRLQGIIVDLLLRNQQLRESNGQPMSA